MHYKKDTKKCFKYGLSLYLVIFLLFNSVIFVQKVDAEFEPSFAIKVYKSALNVINEKFFFKKKIDFDLWENKFENKISTLEEAHDCIGKLVKSLDDPYTKFLTKEEFKDEQDIISSSFVGVGIKIDNDKPVILDVLAGSPAYKEGIRPDDLILAVNETKTKNLNTNQIAKLLSGPKDSFVSIKIKRGSGIQTKILQREELKLKTVSSRMLANDIALVKIDSFVPENTSELFKEEILKLMSAKGLVIDLRGNSGGLLKNAVEIADMFLSEGKIISTVTRDNKKTQYATPLILFENFVVVLVNEKTASASEILAGALQENNRAIVIGKKTFGKGLVQEIIKLPDDSALHVTVALYLTPKGTYINERGIIPDKIVYEDELETAKEILLGLSRQGNKFELASL